MLLELFKREIEADPGLLEKPNGFVVVEPQGFSELVLGDFLFSMEPARGAEVARQRAASLRLEGEAVPDARSEQVEPRGRG
ncbi:hypothetical protein ACYOEI_27030, partial [Singulisphaera rosea]